MTIILPEGTEALWQDAIEAANAGVWDSTAIEMLRAAADTTNMVMRDDLLLLALVACERADQIMETVRIFRLDEPEPSLPAVQLPAEFERVVVSEAAGAMQALASSLAASNIRLFDEEDA